MFLHQCVMRIVFFSSVRSSNYSGNKYSKGVISAEYNLSSKCKSFYDYKYTLLLQSNKIGPIINK